MHLHIPKMRTTTKLVLTLFFMTSTLLYVALNQKHDKYTAEANSGDPHVETRQATGDDTRCEGDDCGMQKVKEKVKLTEEMERHIVDQLRAEMNHYADMPEYDELKKQWKEEEREKQREEARKAMDAKKAEEQKEKEPGDTSGRADGTQEEEEEEEDVNEDVIHLSVVACGDRMEETLVMLKSATLFTKAPMKFHIFTDDDLKEEFTKQLIGWPDIAKRKFTFQLYSVTFPGVKNPDMWIKFFKPCACQRIFLPYILTNVEKLLYVDTDILFFTPLDDLWNFFSEFNSTHISALAPEHEVPWMGWYNRFARHPYYGELGVNSGVMLMNLRSMRGCDWLGHMDKYFNVYRLNMTWGDQDLINVFFHNYPGVNSGVMLMDLERFRASNWSTLMEQYFKKYNKRMTWGDQDLINIYFHYFPEKLYIYPCHWNFRPDHCMYGQVCKSADHHGVRVVHGNRGVYHNEKQPVFKFIYNTIKEFKWDGSLDADLVKVLEAKLQTKESKDTYCGKAAKVFLTGLKNTVNKFQLTQR